MKTVLPLVAFVTILSAGPWASAQSNPLYVPLNRRVNAALYKPDGNPSPQVAVLLVHRTSNFMSHLACTELSKRGFMVLCMNTRFENNEALVNWEKLPLDVKQGIEYLKIKQKISKVILFGHSGGGATTSFYQAVAENGPSYCQGPDKLSQCDNSLAGLPRADAIVLVDAQPAIGVIALRAMNPAVFDEHRPDLIRSDLDPFNPANGYNPNGASHYSEEFVKRYSQAQAKRMNEWIDHALLIRDLMRQGKWVYPDDDSLIIPRASDGATNIFSMDPSILCCTKRPQKLLKNNGTVVTQIVKSVRTPDTGRATLNGTFDQGARILTITSFLTTNAIRATDSLDDSKIDWCSTNSSVPCALRNITVPLLVTAMGAHYFVSDSEYYMENAKSADKEFIVIEGATHGITPCKECQGGPYDNSVKNFFDYVAKWINARFPAQTE